MTNEDEAIVARLGDGNWRARRAALEEAIARVASADEVARDATVAALVRAVGSDENAGLRSAALEALTRVAPAAVSGILAGLEGAPADVRILLAPALGESGAAEAVPALVALVASDDTNVAAAAIVGLGRTRRREALAPLLDALGSGDPWLAGPAAEALGALGDARAAGPLARALDDPFVRATALDALARLATPESARALAARIFAGDGVDARALAALLRPTHEWWLDGPTAAFRDVAAAAFREAYRGDRFAGLEALARRGAPDADAALDALGWSGDARAAAVLLAALDDPDTQDAAAAGLAALAATPELRRTIADAAHNRPAFLRLEAARALARIAPAEAGVLLASVADDDELAADVADVASEAAEWAGDASDGAREAADLLIGALPTASADVRPSLARLARGLASRVDAFDTSPLDALLDAADADLQLAAAEIAGALTGPDARVLGAVRAAFEAGARARAVEVAAEWRAPELVDLFLEALASEDSGVRRAAVVALSRSDDPRAADAVLSACGDAHDVVAASALTAADASRVFDALARAAREGRTLVRCVAAERLAASEDFRSRALAAGLATNDPEPDVRRAAVAAFARRPSSEAAGVADAALEDANRGVRSAALRLAAALGERSRAARIHAAAASDPDGDVRGEALVALADLDPDAALARAGRALFDPSLAVYARRALARVGRTDPARLARYRDGDAPPRAALAADAILAGAEK